jgi:predicted RNA binding protein YcfA (HicA-like mRNA interferase family)
MTISSMMLSLRTRGFKVVQKKGSAKGFDETNQVGSTTK